MSSYIIHQLPISQPIRDLMSEAEYRGVQILPKGFKATDIFLVGLFSMIEESGMLINVDKTKPVKGEEEKKENMPS